MLPYHLYRYAGFYAGRVEAHGVPPILSEHGIYMKERKIDLHRPLD